MTTTDLRGHFTAPFWWAPDDDEPPAKPAPSPDDEGVALPDVAGEGDGGPASDDGEPPANPEIKKLHDEAARHRVRAGEAEAKVEGLTDQVRTLTLRLAFNGLAGDANLTDAEAAWKLAADDLAAVEVADDGTVDTDRLSQIVKHVADRYPYLTRRSHPSDACQQHRLPTHPAQRPIHGRQEAPSQRTRHRTARTQVPCAPPPPVRLVGTAGSDNCIPR